VAREAVDAMAAALDAAEAEAAATRRAHAVLDEAPASAAHSRRTHHEELITGETITKEPSRQ
jgi:hypothetical protein